MRILKLHLKGYKRLFLSNIEEMIYTPENKIQLILGINSSGKSSTLRQLSPLPANLKKDFTKDGFKVIEIEHNNKFYILSSGYEAKNKHSFKVDGIELNESGTITIQNELVEQHFSLNNNIHDLLIGLKSFSIMGPSERKSYITRISDIDYTYGMKYFNKLKQRYRDVKGGIKLIYNEIVNLENKTITDDEYNKIIEELDNLTKLIEYLLSVKSPTSRMNESLEDKEVELDKLTKQLEKYSKYQVVDINELKDNKIKLSTKIEVIDNKLQELNKVLLDYEDNKKVIDVHTDKDLNDIKHDLKSLLEIRDSLVMYLYYKYDEDYEKYLVNWEELKNALELLLEQLFKYDNINLTKDKINALELKYEQNRDIIIRFKDRIKYLEDQIAELESNNVTENITCKVCGSEFEHNHDDDIIKLKKSKDSFINKVNDLENSFKLIKQEKEQYDTLKNIYIELNNLIKSYSVYESFWNEVLDNGNVISVKHDRLKSLFNILIKDIGYLKEINNMDKTINELKKLAKELEYKNKLEEEYKKKNIEKINKEYDELMNEKRLLNSKLEQVNKNIMINDSIMRYKKLLQEKLKEIYKLKEKFLEGIRDNILEDVINKLKYEQIKLNRTLDEYKNYKAILDKNKKLLESETKREQALKILIDEISPDGGMIADSINGFLNKMINDMNKVIAMIWSYDLKILPFDLSNGEEIDYKFKLLVDNREVIEDISLGSSSLKEVVDLAFKIVFQNYVWGYDYPLYLDEFGRTFDSEHREKAYNIINNVLSHNYTNIFLISHFDSLHGRFINADINILSSENSNGKIFDTYNQSIVLKR